MTTSTPRPAVVSFADKEAARRILAFAFDLDADDRDAAHAAIARYWQQQPCTARAMVRAATAEAIGQRREVWVIARRAPYVAWDGRMGALAAGGVL